MSEIVKLNMKSKKIRAVVSDSMPDSESFTEYSEILEKEKEESIHKHELENEYKRGYEEGKQKTKEELDSLHSQELLKQSEDFYNIIKTFEEKIKNYENDFHKLVIGVAGKISEKIIRREMKNKSVIEKVLTENLNKIIGANEISIKLNPVDYKLIEKTKKEFFESNNITKIKFEQTENVTIGGCLIETEIGNLDARNESQINELLKALEEKLTNDEIE